ncbi:MAG: TrmH family RNA methyltransferase [bacterium]|nr:TrmH family RNA methyltransferase [bacterium]
MKKKIYLILPNIRSCHNVGAMFRTADAFGIDKIFLVGYTPAPPKVQIDKVSLGAEKWVPFEVKKDLKKLITKLKKDNVKIIALEIANKSTDISKLTYKGNIALIVGNEVEGVSEDILALCDNVVNIPMLGKKESLNVSIAGGIAMYILNKKR